MKRSTENTTIKAAYQRPQLEIIKLEVEHVFAASNDINSDVEDWEDGGSKRIGIF